MPTDSTPPRFPPGAGDRAGGRVRAVARRRLVVVLALLVAMSTTALVVAPIVRQRVRSDRATSGALLVREPPAPTSAPIAFASSATWSTDDYLEVYEAALADDAVVVHGSGMTGGPELTVRDRATGGVRWAVRQYEPFAGEDELSFAPTSGSASFAVPADGGGPLVTGYFLTQCSQDICHESDVDLTDEVGVVGLDPADGTVRWRHPSVPGVPADSPERDATRGHDVQLLDANDDVVVTQVGPRAGLYDLTDDLEDSRVEVLDTDTGEVRWTAPAVRAVLVADIGVLVIAPGTSSDELRLLDAETGDTRWTTVVPIGAAVSASSGPAPDGGEVVSMVAPGWAPPTRVLDVSTGALIAEVGGPCVGDGAGTLLCLTGREGQVSIAVGEHEVTGGPLLRTVARPFLLGGFVGYFYGDGGAAFDRYGRDHGRFPGTGTVDVDDDAALLVESTSSGAGGAPRRVSVWERTDG